MGCLRYVPKNRNRSHRTWPFFILLTLEVLIPFFNLFHCFYLLFMYFWFIIDSSLQLCLFDHLLCSCFRSLLLFILYSSTTHFSSPVSLKYVISHVHHHETFSLAPSFSCHRTTGPSPLYSAC